MNARAESLRSPKRGLATLSIDLDNEWSYLKTRGDQQWKEYPSYLEILVPRVLSLLRQLDVKPTVFIVGRDASFSRNHAALRLLAQEGYEIGNHSHDHEAWVPHKDEMQFAAELSEAEECIFQAVGTRPRGFRGPGFTSSEAMINVLMQRGYRYDASNLPTFIGPLARLYYFWTSKLTRAERESRKLLFGSIRNGFRPIKPYFIGVNGSQLLEIPVTTIPLLRMPFHVSYILYFSTFSPALARMYWQMALRMCQWTHTPPSILLHPLDFLGKDDNSSLRFFPGMDLTSDVKMARVLGYLKDLTSRFDVVSLGEFCARIENGKKER